MTSVSNFNRKNRNVVLRFISRRFVYIESTNYNIYPFILIVLEGLFFFISNAEKSIIKLQTYSLPISCLSFKVLAVIFATSP